MSKIFRWQSLGFTVRHEVGIMKDVVEFNESIRADQLEALFNLGYFFVNKTHNITIASMEDFKKYIVQ